MKKKSNGQRGLYISTKETDEQHIAKYSKTTPAVTQMALSENAIWSSLSICQTKRPL